MNLNKGILITKMYVGSYLNERNNIGHEIINLFKSDNGKNYIYITDKGVVSNIETIETVLMVGERKNGICEVIAKATGLTPIFDDKNRNQKEYIDNNDIKYVGIKLYDFFKNNTYQGEKQNPETTVYITFESEKVLFPKEKIYLTTDVNKSNKTNNYIFVSSLPGYNLHQFYGKDDKSLIELIDDNSKWETENKTEKLSDNLNYYKMLSRFINVIDNK